MPSTEEGFADLRGPDPHARRRLELLSAYARGAFKLLPELLGIPWLPAPALRALVRRRRRSLVTRAFRDVPFYRDAFRSAGFAAADLGRSDNFAKLPLLTKEHLLSAGGALFSAGAAPRGQLLTRRSSGSTGAPVVVYFDPLREAPRRAQELRMLSSHGVRPRHIQLILDAPAHLPPKPFFLQRMGLWRRVPYPVHLSSEEALDEIERMQPEVIHGVLAGVRMLALAAEARGGLEHRPHRVFCRGELLDAQTRWFIENALGAPLVDFYATEETGIVAWECPSGSGYHVDSDLVHVEVLQEDGTTAAPGQVGELVLTNLFQHTMPIIRYRVGDMGALSPTPCPCGRGLPLLTELQGRRLDFIVTPGGKLHDPFRVMAVFEHVSGVRWFRVQQQSVERLVIQLGFDSELSRKQREHVQAQLRLGFERLFQEPITLEFEDAGQFQVPMGTKAPLVRGLGLSLEQLAEKGYRFRI